MTVAEFMTRFSGRYSSQNNSTNVNLIVSLRAIIETKSELLSIVFFLAGAGVFNCY